MTEVEGSYSVLTGNKFGFLSDDVEDPDEILNSITKEEKPKQKTKKPKPEKATALAALKADDPKQAIKADSTQGAVDQSGAKKPRRERTGQQEGRTAIPRFNEAAAPGSAEAGEGQQRSGRGRGVGQSRGAGFGSGAPRPATAPGDAGTIEGGEGGRGGFGGRGGRGRGGFGGEGGRGSFGEGRGRGGFGEGRGRGGYSEGRGRGGYGEGRGRGGFGEGRGGFGEGRGGFGEGRGGFGEGRGRGRGGFGGPRAADGTAPAAEEGSEDRPATSGGFGRGRGRGGFGGQRGGEQPLAEAEGGAEPSGEDDAAQVSGGDEARAGRGRGRGGFGSGRGGGGRGGRGGFGPDRVGRGREFERHSGSATTGVKPVEKREGGGAHNWGTVKDDLEEQLQEGATAELGEASAAGGPSAKDQDWAEAVDQEAAAGGEEAPAQKAMMTLEEWRKQQADDRAKLQAAKAAEAASRKVDTSGFKEMTAYRKQRLAEGEDDDEEPEAEATPAQLIVKKSEVETNFYVNVNNPQANFDEGRRRGGRGGPRGGRGGRGRGGGGGGGGGEGAGVRVPQHQPAARAAANFRVDDKADFPDLG